VDGAPDPEWPRARSDGPGPAGRARPQPRGDRRRGRGLRQWLSELESGKQTAEVGLVLRVFDALALDLVPQPRGAKGPVLREGAEPVAAVDLDDVLDDYRRR
jgi:hypothetical protein